MADWSIYDSSDYSLEDAYGARFHKLQDICKRINELQYGPLTRLDAVRFEIATGLNIIASEKLYLGSKYKNMQELAKDVLGFTYMSCTSYVRVARKFLEKKRPVSVFVDSDGHDFSMSQLVELGKLSVDEVRNLMKAGAVTYDTPVTGIKAVIKAGKEKQAKDIADAKEAAKKPFEAAHEAFHEAYNALKEHLEIMGDDEGAEKFLPEIMGAVVDMYQEGLNGFLK